MNKLEGVDLKEWLELVGEQESQSLISMADVEEQAWERISQGVRQFGDTLPWEKTHDKFRLRPNEVTLWAGGNGSGKSLVLSQITAALCLQSNITLASLEMTPAAIAQRFIRQVAATRNVSRADVSRILSVTRDVYWIYDECDSVERDRILGLCVYAMRELKCGHVVIDSLVKCGISGDDYSSQKDFVDRLCWIAKTYGGHIHLVHHIRKGSSEKDVPDKHDIKGAGEVTDLVDNCVLVWRNKRKEDIRQQGDAVDQEEPDAMLIVCKQRHGEWEGKIKLFFDPESHQYLGAPREMARRIF